MRKLIPVVLENGCEFNICSSWKNKIAEVLNINEEMLSTHFTIIDNYEELYLCESKNGIKLWLTDNVIYYLKGRSVRDCNAGMYFEDYYPVEDNKLLVFNKKEKMLIPIHFKLSIGIQDDIPLLFFIFRNLLNNEECNFDFYSCCSWKYLKDTETYMTDEEKMYQDTFIHKEYVLKVCEKFAKYLSDNGLQQEAKELQQRAIIHDNSKIQNIDEFQALTSIINDKKSLGNTEVQLSPLKQKSIALHWQNNAHHPEHYENYEDMSKIDRLEMVSDWMARSLQYKNDLVEFVEKKQKQRFQFTDAMYKEILSYCKILATLFAEEESSPD